MGMVIGIDVGGSTTKIIGVDKEGIKHPMIVKAEDPITSLFGAFGKYIYDNGISLNDIDKVMLTGVGSAYVNQPLICNTPLPGLPLDATASTFGKASSNASMEDVAAGIIHMVLQSIGQSVILAALNSHIKDFVLIGNLTKMPQCKEIFPVMEEMYQCHFWIPEYAEYRTALGAALAYTHK